MNPWELPTELEVGGKTYPIHGDFRNIIKIMQVLAEDHKPVLFRWLVAVGLFYEGEIPDEHLQEAMETLSQFLTMGQPDDGKPSPKLLDWDQDSRAIIADVNRAAGTEIRALPFLHWWTFLSYFNAIGEGQLSTMVSIRSKLAKRKKLDDWEKDYYREHKAEIDLRRKLTPEEIEEKERINALLNGGG